MTVQGEQMKVLVLNGSPKSERSNTLNITKAFLAGFPEDTEVEYVNLDEVEGWYSKSKAMATNNVYTAIRERGLKACVVYPTGIMGPNDFSCSETTSTIIKIIKGEMAAGIDGSFNHFCHSFLQSLSFES